MEEYMVNADASYGKTHRGRAGEERWEAGVSD